MEVSVGPEDWYKVAQDLRRFEPGLQRSLRRKLRDAGQKGVDAVRDKLAEGSPDGGPDVGTNRSLLAAGTKVSVSFAKSGGKVRITTSGARLPAEHRALFAAYNMRQWRHPVYGNRDNWDAQLGNPYFYGAVMSAGTREMRDGIEAAMNDAVRAIGAR